MDNLTSQDPSSSFSGLIKLFAQGKTWIEYWTVLESNKLRFHESQESFQAGVKETCVIQLTPQTYCKVLRRSNNSFHVYVDGTFYRFKCASGSVRQQWLNNLAMALRSFCRKTCFHCCEPNCVIKEEVGDATECGSVSSDVSSADLAQFGSLDEDSCENNARYSFDCTEMATQDRITTPSLMLFESQDNLSFSFSRNSEGEKTRTELENNPERLSPTISCANDNDIQNSFPKRNSFGFAPSSTNRDPELGPTSPLKIFNSQYKRFSTFLTNSNLGPGISKGISTQYAPLINYDVPSLSKRDPHCCFLKMLTGKKTWKKFRAVVDKNQLLLSDPETNNSNDSVCIELKPGLQFVHLPRRTHDYRFKMTTDSSTEYFLKTPTVFERDKWIETLTVASRSICQNSCVQCCRKRSRTSSSVVEEGSETQDVLDGEMVDDEGDEDGRDDVFYVEMDNDGGAIMFANPTTRNSEPSDCKLRLIHGDGETPNDRDKTMDDPKSGFIKTNAVDNEWQQYWAVISGNKLTLYLNENYSKEVKTIEVSPDAVQCRSVRRKSSSYRFVLFTSATCSYKFKCESARARKQWMVALEKISSIRDAPSVEASGNVIEKTTASEVQTKESGKGREVGEEIERNWKGKVEAKEEKIQKREENEEVCVMVRGNVFGKPKVPEVQKNGNSKEVENEEEKQDKFREKEEVEEVVEVSGVEISGNDFEKTLKVPKIQENECSKGLRVEEQEIERMGKEKEDGEKQDIGEKEEKGELEEEEDGDFYETMNSMLDVNSGKAESTRQNQNSWNFEEHIQNFDSKLKKGKQEGELTESIVPLKMEVQDTEEFLTNVLGKIHLPPEVNKQRLELSERLRKLLKKDVAPAFKPRLDPPTETTHVEELYDDVAAGVTADEEIAENDVQELYDDVKQEEPEENYDDVVGATSMIAEPTEIYDDVADKPQPTPVLDTQHVADLKKAADIQGIVYKGQLDKYKTRGITLVSKWQRRHFVLTPLALYYYANLRDKQQKGTIVLVASGYVVRKGSPSYPDVKDGKMCFEIGDHERNFLFKVEKQEEVDIWIEHIKSALTTKLSEKDISSIRKQSKKMAEEKNVEKEKIKEKDKDKKKTGEEKIEEQTEPEELYELMDNYVKNENSSSSNETAPFQEELYEETDQFSSVKETLPSSNGLPTLPSRVSAVEEDFDEPTEVEDYEFPDVGAKPPAVSVEIQEDYELPGLKPKPSVPASPRQPHKTPALPPRNTSVQDGPSLPPRPGNSSVQPAKSPPSIPTRTTPGPKATPDSLKPPAGQVEPSTPASPAKKPEVVPNPSPAPPVVRTKPTKGEQFDYAKVYVAMWNCDADDDDDLSFSRGNQLYIREKIPNSDWWVASLMDSPDIRVGLVPRNYIMPAYEL